MNLKEITHVTKTLKLLYVEDDETARVSTLELLDNFFTNITIAIDGEDGLAKFKADNFDIVLSDINMPKLSGTQMVSEIRALDENVSVLFLSAYNESSFLSEGIKLSVDGYILKPLKLKDFIIVLSKVCEKITLKKESVNYQTNLEYEVKKQTQELDIKLHFDELTGLHNRYSYFEDMKTMVTAIVFIIDINKFQIINEIYGTDIGSLVLQEFANFLLQFTKNSNYRVYRLSGDEFIIRDNIEYIDPEKYEDDISRFFEKLSNFEVEIDNDSISIEVTLGISTFQSDAYECAKIALKFAKEHKMVYKMYSTAIDKRSEEQDALAWKNRTKLAIAQKRITAVYQPIVDKDSKIVKYETLMRLRDADSEKLISPFFFLDIAIKTGLYNTLSTYIVFEALNLLRNSPHTLSINFTYGDITNRVLLNDIELFLKDNSTVGQRTIFEITESENIADYDVIKKFIQRFRIYGIRVAIDDFGSGFSNFEYILEIEPDYLKIDGSLVKNIDKDEKAHILVEAIVEFSHKLGIKIIAEYVHSEVIFEMLKDLNVDEFQGFYFWEPLENILEVDKG